MGVRHCSREYENNIILLSSKSLLTLGDRHNVETNTNTLNIDKYNENKIKC